MLPPISLGGAVGCWRSGKKSPLIAIGAPDTYRDNFLPHVCVCAVEAHRVGLCPAVQPVCAHRVALAAPVRGVWCSLSQGWE
eukprot:scaffold177392_cov31-Tisochrysis_lutea.AAC.1